MSSVQIPNLPAAIGLSGAEELEIVQGGTSARTTVGAIALFADTDAMYRTGGVNVAYFGVLPSNLPSVNVAIIQRLIDEGYEHLYFPEGTYQINGYWNLTGSSINTITLAMGATIEQTANLPIWYKVGSMPTTRYYLTANAQIGDNHVTVSLADSANFSENDWIFVRGTETTPGVTAGSRVACIRQVTGTGAGPVYIDAAIYRAMSAAGSVLAYCTKFTPGARMVFEGGTYRHSDKSNTMCLFDFLLCEAPDIRGVKLEHSGASGYRFAHCIGGSFNYSHIFDLTDDIPTGHGGYGIALCGATRGFCLSSGSIGHVRHAITTGSVFSSSGGYDSALPLPADLVNTIQGSGEPENSYYGPVYCYNTTNAALDMHEQGFGFTIIPNVHGCFDGILIRADEAHVIGGSITNCRRSGIRIDLPASNPAATNPLKASISGVTIANIAQQGSDCYGIWAEVPGASIDITDVNIRGNFNTGILSSANISWFINGGMVDGGAALGTGKTGLDLNTPNVMIRNLMVKNMDVGINTHGYVESSGFTMRHVEFSGNTTDVTPATTFPYINDHDISSVWHISGRYYTNGGYTGVGTSGALGNDSFRVAPFLVRKPVTLSRIGAEITVGGTAGCTVRLGIYGSDRTGYPSGLVLDAGTIPGDVIGAAELTISTTLQPGVYWMGAVIQGTPATQPTFRIVNTSNPTLGANSLSVAISAGMVAYGMTAVGALPATFTAGSQTGALAARVAVKIA